MLDRSEASISPGLLATVFAVDLTAVIVVICTVVLAMAAFVSSLLINLSDSATLDTASSATLVTAIQRLPIDAAGVSSALTARSSSESIARACQTVRSDARNVALLLSGSDVVTRATGEPLVFGYSNAAAECADAARAGDRSGTTRAIDRLNAAGNELRAVAAKLLG